MPQRILEESLNEQWKTVQNPNEINYTYWHIVGISRMTIRNSAIP